MLARSLSLVGVGLLALAACSSEDDWAVHPPGGGTGTGSDGDHDAGSDGGAGTTGRLCVVSDLRAPDRCPSTSQAGGATVRVAGGASTTSDASGRFTLPAVTGTRVMEVDGTATLVAVTIPITADGHPLALPVPLASSFQDVLDSVSVPGLGGEGGIVIYVDDRAGAALPGVVFDGVAGAAYAVLYDDGGATNWRIDGGTGLAGVALMLGVPQGTYSLAGAVGANQLTVDSVPVRADAVTFVRTALR